MKNYCIVFLLSLCTTVFLSCQNGNNTNQDDLAKAEIAAKKPSLPQSKYGFNLSKYNLVSDTIQSGESFGSIMYDHGVSIKKVFDITHQIPDSLNATKLIAGKPYIVVNQEGKEERPVAFIYQKDKIHYTVIHFDDSIRVQLKKRPVTIKHRTISGVINSSLSQAINKAGGGIALAHQIAKIYQWKIDFFRVKKGDKFKVIFNEKYINDSIYAGLGSIKAAEFVHYGEPHYAFNYDTDSTNSDSFNFYNEKAESLQSFFLKAPLDHFRITSHYSKNRYHPILHRYMGHLGTDYAAPTGTPIHVTADGVVIASRYTKYNGNYVKVRHNSKYTTQYLHMSERNVSVGEHVSQGDVIGFVGSTGLATGPHVCYRFWVNGKQVDPYKQDLPHGAPLTDSLKDDYFKYIKPLKNRLDNMVVDKGNNKKVLAGFSVN